MDWGHRIRPGSLSYVAALPRMKVPRVRMVRPHGLPASCILVAVLCFACGSEPKPRGRVLLVGIDGASLQIARPLIREGKLPNLARIARDGVSGPLRSHLPLASPRIWASIATGKSPKHHGVLSFARKAADGEQRLYQSFDRKAHALWNIVSDAGKSVAVVNWWTTYPVEKVRGVVVSDHLLAWEVQGRRNLTGAPAVALPERLSQRYRNDERVTRIALEIEREVRPDVLMVLLPGIDRVSHRLWGALRPEYPRNLFTPEQRETSVAALRRYYEYTDALIGELQKT